MKIQRFPVFVFFVMLVCILFSSVAVASDYETHWSAYYIHAAKERGWLSADATGAFEDDYNNGINCLQFQHTITTRREICSPPENQSGTHRL